MSTQTRGETKCPNKLYECTLLMKGKVLLKLKGYDRFCWADEVLGSMALEYSPDLFCCIFKKCGKSSISILPGKYWKVTHSVWPSPPI